MTSVFEIRRARLVEACRLAALAGLPAPNDAALAAAMMVRVCDVPAALQQAAFDGAIRIRLAHPRVIEAVDGSWCTAWPGQVPARHRRPGPAITTRTQDRISALWKLLSDAAKAGEAAPSNRQIADRLGLSADNLSVRLIAQAVSMGLIVVERGHMNRVIAAADGSWRTAGVVTHPRPEQKRRATDKGPA